MNASNLTSKTPKSEAYEAKKKKIDQVKFHGMKTMESRKEGEEKRMEQRRKIKLTICTKKHNTLKRPGWNSKFLKTLSSDRFLP